MFEDELSVPFDNAGVDEEQSPITTDDEENPQIAAELHESLVVEDVLRREAEEKVPMGALGKKEALGDAP